MQVLATFFPTDPSMSVMFTRDTSQQTDAFSWVSILNGEYTHCCYRLLNMVNLNRSGLTDCMFCTLVCCLFGLSSPNYSNLHVLHGTTCYMHIHAAYMSAYN